MPDEENMETFDERLINIRNGFRDLAKNAKDKHLDVLQTVVLAIKLEQEIAPLLTAEQQEKLNEIVRFLAVEEVSLRPEGFDLKQS